MTDSPVALSCDDDGLRLPEGIADDLVYDVVVNGSPVWSLHAGRDAEGPDRAVRWPATLRRMLRGTATVELVQHVTGQLMASTEAVFAGVTDREVSVTDDTGARLVVDKWGRLVRPLSGEGAAVIEELLDETERLLATIRESAGLPAFICYGTLLGAVRGGKLIGHDNDIDLAYASEATHPVDVNRECLRVERALRRAGWQVRRGSGVRLNVPVTLSDGSVRYIDVFSACWIEGVLYIPSDFGVEVARDVVLPLTTVELEGRQLPAPARSEDLLALTYGPTWDVPDPSFRFDSPPSLARHLNGWFGGVSPHRKHWDSFAQTAQRAVPESPSPFARWVQEHHPGDGLLVDLGAGTARDSLWFAERGREVLALEYSPGATRRGLRRAAQQERPGHERVRAEVANLYDLRAVLALGARLAREDQPVDLYARFLLHSLAPVGREHLIRLAAMSLRRGGRLFLEFRTKADRPLPRHFEHGARYFQEVKQVRTLIEEHGGQVLAQDRGRGLAPFGEEDPEVCRIVAGWSQVVGP